MTEAGPTLLQPPSTHASSMLLAAQVFCLRMGTSIPGGRAFPADSSANARFLRAWHSVRTLEHRSRSARARRLAESAHGVWAATFLPCAECFKTNTGFATPPSAGLFAS